MKAYACVHEFIRMIEKVSPFFPVPRASLLEGLFVYCIKEARDDGEKSDRIIFCIQDASKLIFIT